MDPVRFLANVVLETDEDERGWSGRELHLGPDVVLSVGPAMVRCRMVDLAQRGLPTHGGLLKTLAATSGLALGLRADVVRAGVVRVGDPARLIWM